MVICWYHTFIDWLIMRDVCVCMKAVIFIGVICIDFWIWRVSLNTVPNLWLHKEILKYLSAFSETIFKLWRKSGYYDFIFAQNKCVIYWTRRWKETSCFVQVVLSAYHARAHTCLVSVSEDMEEFRHHHSLDSWKDNSYSHSILMLWMESRNLMRRLYYGPKSLSINGIAVSTCLLRVFELGKDQGTCMVIGVLQLQTFICVCDMPSSMYQFCQCFLMLFVILVTFLFANLCLLVCDFVNFGIHV